MDKTEKQKKLSTIKEILSRNLRENGFVKNTENVFYRLHGEECCLWELVYTLSIEHEVEFELLDLNNHYFAGSLQHAKKLLKHYGGCIWRTKLHQMKEKPRDLWVWNLDTKTIKKHQKGGKTEPMNDEDATRVIFA